jgi:hypothetical protein
MATDQSNTKTRRSLYCNHCKQPAARRSDLNDRLLCATCATIPGVPGYWNPSKRGLDPRYGTNLNGDAYWRANEEALRRSIVSDEPNEPAGATPAPSQSSGTPAPRQRKPQTATQARFKAWTHDVSAAHNLSGDAKNLARVIGDRADFRTGDNAWPALATLATNTGGTVKRVKRLVRELVTAGWVEVVHRRLKGRHTSNRYALRWPDGRTVVPVEHESGTPTVVPR